MKNLKFKMCFGFIALILLTFTILNELNERQIDETNQAIMLKRGLIDTNHLLSDAYQDTKEDMIYAKLFSNESLADSELIENYVNISMKQIVFLNSSKIINEEVTADLYHLADLKKISEFIQYPLIFLSFLNAFFGVILIILESKK